MTLLYRIGIWLYSSLIRTASRWNSKAKQWVQGRRNWRSNYPVYKDSDNVIWMHCASLGEFEQGKPVLEELKKNRPGSRIVVTFFSPSGFEHRKDYEGADSVLYLPPDTPQNARRFIEQIRPSIAIFVKYELWYYYLRELKKRDIPSYLISAHFRKGHRYFKWYGGIFRRMLRILDHIFVQDSRSMGLLKEIGCTSCTVAGDTRFDRVLTTVKDAAELPLIDRFKNGQTLVVGGSTWPPEEKIMSDVYSSGPDTRWVIAPHDISETHIKQIEAKFGATTVRYSELEKAPEQADSYDVLIIDNIGLLSRMYRYADLAVIGGGFSGSLHNILEAAAFGVPVLFGPNHQRFPEAQQLIDAGGASVISVRRGVITLREMIENSSERGRFSTAAGEFVKAKSGATQTVVEGILGDRN